jgi:hypothetical protein
MLGGMRGQVNESRGVVGISKGLLAKHRHFTHPIKEDVKKKLFPSPLWRPAGWLTSSPVPFVEGFLVFAALDRRVLQRRSNRS